MNTVIDEKNKENPEIIPSDPLDSRIDQATLEEMTKAGIFYGRKKSRTNPKLRDFIFTAKNSIEIIDLSNTLKLMMNAKQFLEELFVNKPSAKVLIVGTHPSSEDCVKKIATDFGFPYVTNRWIGGTLTNFKTISNRISTFRNLKSEKASGALGKYTKKEKVMFDKEIIRMDRIFAGVELMTQLPEALLVFNAKLHITAIREANRMHIPVIAVLNTDAELTGIDFPILANDNTKPSINWIGAYFSKIFEAVVKK